MTGKNMFAYSTITYKKEELPLALEQISHAGYDGVELCPKDWEWGLETLGKKGLVHLFAKYSLMVASLYGGLLGADLSELEEACRIGNALGSENVFVLAPVAGSATYDQVLQWAKDACGIAAKYGMILLIHHHAGTFMDELSVCEKLCADIREPNYGLCFDSLHLSLYEDQVEDKLSNLLPYIRYVHFKDLEMDRTEFYKIKPKETWRFGDLGHLEKHYMDLGDGIIHHAAIAEVIRNYGYTGWWEPEIERIYLDRKTQVERNYQRIREYVR